jgi:hypothetical protein
LTTHDLSSSTNQPEANEGGELIDKAETNQIDPCNDGEQKRRRGNHNKDMERASMDVGEDRGELQRG